MLFLLKYKDMEWSGNVIRYGIGFFWHCAILFGTVRFLDFLNIFFEFLTQPRPPLEITLLLDNYSAAV